MPTIAIGGMGKSKELHDRERHDTVSRGDRAKYESPLTGPAAFAGAIVGGVTGTLYQLFQPPPLTEENWGFITTAILAGQHAAIAFVVFAGLALTVLRSRSTSQVVGYLSVLWLASFLLGSVVDWVMSSASRGSAGAVMVAITTPLNWAVVGTILGGVVVSRSVR